MTRQQRRAPSQRQLRVGEEIRHALSEVFTRGELRDPVLAGRSITVTEVQASPDLTNATAFVMPLGERMDADDEAELLKALKRSAPFLRGRVNQAVYLRRSPHISFAIDKTFGATEHLDQMLRRPEVARDLAVEGGENSADSDTPDDTDTKNSEPGDGA
ncbi:MAG: 30S ribosome-binding factor RbfA [Alphaproteobacteria bacterium]|jgi:ribosome-binding factor A|nr:30S ribosome-binding factor RbfA [Alphaproteobacteria bacterium]MBT4711689.1 30S ribosome-binding factor RbfA [Alphaproteobacteria bacterium]MBT5860233.1 30S ribosome-binding factor RbfA [Alphaproteobacteria bacterium]